MDSSGCDFYLVFVPFGDIDDDINRISTVPPVWMIQRLSGEFAA
jgi:hypothetical protein